MRSNSLLCCCGEVFSTTTTMTMTTKTTTAQLFVTQVTHLSVLSILCCIFFSVLPNAMPGGNMKCSGAKRPWRRQRSECFSEFERERYRRAHDHSTENTRTCKTGQTSWKLHLKFLSKTKESSKHPKRFSFLERRKTLQTPTTRGSCKHQLVF